MYDVITLFSSALPGLLASFPRIKEFAADIDAAAAAAADHDHESADSNNKDGGGSDGDAAHAHNGMTISFEWPSRFLQAQDKTSRRSLMQEALLEFAHTKVPVVNGGNANTARARPVVVEIHRDAFAGSDLEVRLQFPLACVIISHRNVRASA